MQSARGVGDGHAGLAQLFPGAGAQIAGDARRVGDVVDPDAQLVDHGAVLEGDHVDVGRRLVERPRHAGGAVGQHAAHPVGRLLVMHRHADALEVQGVRVVEVVDPLLGELGVGDDDVVVVAGAQVGGAPGDRHHPALVLLAHPDPVVDAERPFEADHQAGEEVGQDRLQRQAEHQGGDGAGGEQRPDVEGREAKLEGHHGGDQVDQRHRHRRQQRRQAHAALAQQVDVEEQQRQQAEDGDQAEEQQRPGERRGQPGDAGPQAAEDLERRRQRRHDEREGQLAHHEGAAPQEADGEDQQRQHAGAGNERQGRGHLCALAVRMRVVRSSMPSPCRRCGKPGAL